MLMHVYDGFVLPVPYHNNAALETVGKLSIMGVHCTIRCNVHRATVPHTYVCVCVCCVLFHYWPLCSNGKIVFMYILYIRLAEATIHLLHSAHIIIIA